MSTITTTQIFHDEHVAGGWTEFEDVTRRICKALWHATKAFRLIRNYESDVILDYMIVLDVIKGLLPGTSFDFTYSVGPNGTHLAVKLPGLTERQLAAYEAHAASVLSYDSGSGTAKFIGTVTRSDYKTDSYTGAPYGADRYGLTIESVNDVARS